VTGTCHIGVMNLAAAAAPLGQCPGEGRHASHRYINFLWLHFALTHVGSEQWLRPHLDVPEDFYELMKTRSSTRIEVADNALLGVINDVAFFSTDVSTSATMILYVTVRIMVSARTTQLRSVDRLRSAVKRGEPFRSPADLLAHEADQPSMRPVSR
jgi:zinc transporter